MKLFLAGDVMTGRGIDQVLAHHADPTLHERYVRSASGYVELAERANGPIPGPVAPSYLWGDALAELDRAAPAARIVNLETAVTTHDDWDRDKGIHYRMHPENVDILTAAGIDACVLANNHVLDWGRAGLDETLRTLASAGLAVVGAGNEDASAAASTVLDTPAGRLRIHAWATPGAGVPRHWAAGPDTPGINRLPTVDDAAAATVVEAVSAAAQPGERTVVSFHWGGNWGFDVPQAHRELAHAVLDSGRVDLVFGHSSHHPMGIEVYRGRPILYGAGDFLNDYEGIRSHQEYRGDLVLMYFPELGPSGELQRLAMTPMRIRRFRLERASAEEVAWVAGRMDRECGALGAAGVTVEERRLELRW